MMRMGRIVKSFNTFGSTTGVDVIANPLWEASINKFDKSKYTNIRNTFRIEWDVVKGIKVIHECRLYHSNR